jgi:hypothetical protein
MLIVDLIAAACIAAVVAWGVRAGVAGTLAPAGFAAGAIVGALAAPLLLDDGQESTFALAFALPGALLCGAIVAAVVERRTLRLRRRHARLDRLRTVDAVGGGLLGCWIGLVAVWLLSATAVQVTSLRERVEDSLIAGHLDSVLGLPGPGAPDVGTPIDLFPVVAGDLPSIRPVDPTVVTDPDVLRADRSVVRIGVTTCGRRGSGSGWIAADGVVVTNAHVAEAASRISVRLHGAGPALAASPIWFDPNNDLALLRVPALVGQRPLEAVRLPKRGAKAAIIGFPLGEHAIRPARLGPTTKRVQGRIGNIRRGSALRRTIGGYLTTVFLGRSLPGNSGGPVVDDHGRVLTTVWGGKPNVGGGMGVPNRFVRSALRRAGPPVGVGKCLGPSSERLG